MAQPRILITSGNANVGFETLKALAALGEKNILVGARDVAKSEQKLKQAGALDVVELDLENAQSVKNAFKGVERALLVAGGMNMELYAKNFADAAKATPSVNFIARISGGASDAASEMATARKQGLSDALIKTAGINYVLIQPNFFFTNIVSKKDQIKAGNVATGSGEGRTAYIAPEDIGAVAATLLHNPVKARVNSALQITGPAAITDGELIQAVGKAIGKSINVILLSLEDQDKALRSRGLPENLVQLFHILDFVRLNSYAAHTSDNVEKVLGRKPINAEEWALLHKNDFN